MGQQIGPEELAKAAGAFLAKHIETFACQECGKKFKTTRAAERAQWDGCPKCGGTDIDLDCS